MTYRVAIKIWNWQHFSPKRPPRWSSWRKAISVVCKHVRRYSAYRGIAIGGAK